MRRFRPSLAPVLVPHLVLVAPIGPAPAIPSPTTAGAARGPSGPWLTIFDRASGTRFGSALDLVGDCDGDGIGDLAVGAYRSGGGAGALHLVSGADGARLWTLAGDGNDWLGFDVAGTGDLDGDRVPDLVAGAPFAGEASGQLRALSGRDGSMLWSRSGSVPGQRYAQAVAGIGDVDADGVPDLAVGIPFDNGGGTYAGRVELLSGRGGLLLAALQGASFDQLGYDVAGVGDLDGDGAGDCAIGAPFDDRGGANAGALVIVSGASGGRLFEVFGAAAGDWLGHRVAGAGDVDGDGLPEVLVSAPGADVSGFDSGAAQVRSGADAALLLEIPGEQAGEYLTAVGGPGDVDGDGSADVLVGSAAGGIAEAGRVRLVSGRSGRLLCAFDGLAPKDWYGFAVGPAGDLDGDGRPELAIGAPGHDDEVVVGYVQLVRCDGRERPWQVDGERAVSRRPFTPTQRP
jgi:hypothetical protein